MVSKLEDIAIKGGYPVASMTLLVVTLLFSSKKLLPGYRVSATQIFPNLRKTIVFTSKRIILMLNWCLLSASYPPFFSTISSY